MTDAIDQPDVTMTGRLSTRDLPGGSPGSLRVPALVALPDGPLLLVHDHRPRPGAGAWREHGGALPDDLPNPNSLWLRRSEDAGATWSAPQRLMPTDVGLGGVSDPSVLYDPRTGRLHLFAAAATDVGLFGAHPPSRSAREGLAPEPGTLRLLHAVSPDAGITWDWEDLTALLAPTAERPDGVVGFPVSGHGLALAHGAHAGRLVQPLVTALAPRPDGTRPVRATALLSDDAGATWFLGRDVPAPEGAGAASLAGGAATTGVDEWALAELPAGSGEQGGLLLSARDGGYGGRRLTAQSRDGAMTWTTPRPEETLPDPGCNGSLVGLPGGAMVCSHAGDPRSRCAGRLSVLPAGASAWRDLAVLTGPDEPFGYSDAAVIPRFPGSGARVVVVAEQPQEPDTTLACFVVET